MMVERRNPARVDEVSSRPYAWKAVPAALSAPSSIPARVNSPRFLPDASAAGSAARRPRDSSRATPANTKEKGTREMSMRTAESSAGVGAVGDS